MLMLIYIVAFFLLVCFSRDMHDPIGWSEWQDIFDKIKEDLKKAIRGE